MARKLLIFFLLLVTVAAGAWGFSQHRQLAGVEFQLRRLALLERENTRLQGLVEQRVQAEAKDAGLARRAEVEQAVEKVRGLKFLKPVVYEVLTREGVRETIEQKIADQYSDAELENIATGLAAVGLLPPEFPLKQRYLDLLGEQVAAFYDQHAHKLYMFEDASLENAQNRMVLAHELTHALQDQHFRLNTMPLEIKDNDDRAVAASALVEGDATVLMTEFMMGNFSIGAVKDALAGALSQNMQQLSSAPRYLRESLLFPYVYGQQFAMVLQAQGGWEAVNKAYANPPSSTAQILHPEKYLEPREEPIGVDWLEKKLEGQPLILNNVIGELGFLILFSEWADSRRAPEVADGWRGDRYLVFGNAKEWSYVMKTVWAGPEDAEEFFEAMKGVLRKRHATTEVAEETPERFAFTGSRSVLMERRPDNVVVLYDAAADKWVEAMKERFR